MTFSLRDTTGTLADSDPFRIDFSPIPEPGAGLLLLWTLAFLRRR